MNEDSKNTSSSERQYSQTKKDVIASVYSILVLLALMALYFLYG